MPQKKTILSLCFQFLFHLLTIEPLTYVLGRPLMQGHPVSYAYHQMVAASSRNRLRFYLENSTEERQNQKPFFPLPNFADLQTQQTYNLINQMVQSRTEDWSAYLFEIFKMNPSSHNRAFWKLLGVLSIYMPTPALQMTVFEVEKFISSIHDLDTTTVRAVNLKTAKAKFTRIMREHVVLLGQKGWKASRFIDIFTKEQQEKMGEYAIRLETSWSSRHDEEDLIKYWASNLNLYFDVEGTLKEILEKQVILVGLVKQERRLSVKISPISELIPTYDHWVGSRIGALMKELIDYISCLNDEDVILFARIQSRSQLGFHVNTNLAAKDIRNTLMFWTKNTSLYLQVDSMSESGAKLNIIEQLIVEDSNQLSSAIQDFVKCQGYDQIENFLQPFYKKTQPSSLKRAAEGKLEHTSDHIPVTTAFKRMRLS